VLELNYNNFGGLTILNFGELRLFPLVRIISIIVPQADQPVSISARAFVWVNNGSKSNLAQLSLSIFGTRWIIYQARQPRLLSVVELTGDLSVVHKTVRCSSGG